MAEAFIHLQAAEPAPSVAGQGEKWIVPEIALTAKINAEPENERLREKNSRKITCNNGGQQGRLFILFH